MKVCLIVQARMNSERLPGKVMKEVLGKPLLQYQLERLDRVKFKDELIVATTSNASDEPIVDFCRQHSVLCFRGSEQDVLERFYEAASWRSAETVGRVTGDCPLIDPEIVSEVLEFYLNNTSHYDYVSNVLLRTYPRGMDFEVFNSRVLGEAHREAKLRSEREHVTPFIYSHAERYRLGVLKNSADESRHRWTVDTPEDFELIRKILVDLYPKNPQFSMKDVLELLTLHPEWETANAYIRQKELNS